MYSVYQIGNDVNVYFIRRSLKLRDITFLLTENGKILWNLENESGIPIAQKIVKNV